MHLLTVRIWCASLDMDTGENLQSESVQSLKHIVTMQNYIQEHSRLLIEVSQSTHKALRRLNVQPSILDSHVCQDDCLKALSCCATKHRVISQISLGHKVLPCASYVGVTDSQSFFFFCLGFKRTSLWIWVLLFLDSNETNGTKRETQTRREAGGKGSPE